MVGHTQPVTDGRAGRKSEGADLAAGRELARSDAAGHSKKVTHCCAEHPDRLGLRRTGPEIEFTSNRSGNVRIVGHIVKCVGGHSLGSERFRLGRPGQRQPDAARVPAGTALCVRINAAEAAGAG